MYRKLNWIVILTLLTMFILPACAPETNTAAIPTEIENSPSPVGVNQDEMGTSENNEEIEKSEDDSQIDDQQLVELTDGLGREVTLKKPATAIVSTSPSITESLFAIGAGNLIIGRDEYSISPEEALDIPSFGSLYGNFPAETILEMSPDLVIAAEIIPEEQIYALEELGLTVFWQSDPKDFNDLYQNLIVMGQLTGLEAETHTLIESLKIRVSAVEEKTIGLDETPLVFYELDATDPDNPWTSGTGTFIDAILMIAGGRNIGGVLEGDYAQISSEEIINQNPDIILLADAAYGVTPEMVADRSGWDGITAVKLNALYPIDPFLTSVPGPNLVTGLEAIAVLLHPDLFE
jgi:iron complex transport system substrate-binding protein